MAMVGAQDAYTTRELADLLNVSRQAIDLRAEREGWQSRPRKGSGGGYEWLVSSMPEATRLAIASKVVPVQPAPASDVQQEGVACVVQLTGNARQRAEVRTALLMLCRAFTNAAGLSHTRGMEAFCARWNAGEIEAEPWLRAAKPRICKRSLQNWQRTVKTEGVTRLGGRQGQHLAGKGRIDAQPAVRDLILGMIAEYPDVSAQLVLERLQARFCGTPTKLPSLRRLQAWMRGWKLANAGAYLFTQAPDTWRGRALPSMGDIYAHIVRYNQLWEYDGTPADLMLNDGKRYAIVGIINVYSRELRLEVAPTSTASVVANITRNCILEWGHPETIVTDNGKEFTALHIQGLALALDIHLNVLPPFRADLKPAIERAFRTFSHHLLTLCPCYVGHNVATRQKIRERKTFADRLMNRSDIAELSMAMSPEELQALCDDWTRNVYAHKPHSGLRGKTPYQMRQEWAGPIRRIHNERALDVLLMPLADGDGWRTVRKDGVHCEGGQYIATELGAYVGMRVQVRINRTDRAHAYIFDEGGLFICTAVNVLELNPHERRDVAVAARQTGVRKVKAEARHLRALAKKTGASDAAKEILEYHIARAAEIEAANPLPTPTVIDHITFELAEAARAADESGPVQTIAPAEAEVARKQAADALQDELYPIPADPAGRNRAYLDYSARRIRGEDLPQRIIDWINMYPTTPEAYGFAEMSNLFAVAVNA